MYRSLHPIRRAAAVLMIVGVVVLARSANNANGAMDTPAPCRVGTDCDDRDSCTSDRCIDGRCTNPPIPGCVNRMLDDDADGVPNEFDRCPQTPAGELADVDGCSRSQGGMFADTGTVDVPMTEGPPDSDGDNVADVFDRCPGTPADVVAVDSAGCPAGDPPDFAPQNPVPTTGAGSQSAATPCGAVGTVNLLMMFLVCLTWSPPGRGAA